MLKSLELIGFKSFADKTVIEFSPGITAIVGPNGSGKSNIVDAVRWILGEQSAKSLRGGEMVDVIFNGSTSRRSLGMAEVTMTFDNTKRYLAVDCDEVQITRRVYRDGQGEYLINRQPSRLRDIKDLFLGSGAGQGHYCIIEQGRVDALLQASHKDRRLIFEEAAGISRFKARKTEALRKLEAVEQNLARAKDLLDELEKQWRSVQLQAAKAQRYQEYSERLKTLRLGLGLQEFHELTMQWQAETEAWSNLQRELQSMTDQERQAEAEIRQVDAELAALDEKVRETETAIAHARQDINTYRTRDEFEAAALYELEAELTQIRRQREALTHRLAELQDLAAQADLERQSVQEQVEQQRQKVAQGETLLAASEAELVRARRQLEADRAEHLERMRTAARLQNEVITLRARLDNLQTRRDGLRSRSAQTVEHLAQIDRVLDDLVQSEAHIQQMLVEGRQTLAQLEEQRDELSRQIDQIEKQIAELRVQRGALASRIDLLEQWERGHEGLGVGVRKILERLRTTEEITGGDWSFVIGLVADVLTVPREYAAIIDFALGEVAQFLLVSDSTVLDQALNNWSQPLAGRVGFITWPPTVPALEPPDSEDVGQRLDHLVACDHPNLAGLPALLLGSTRLVDDLGTAREMARRFPGRFRFVTRRGELLERDGTLIVGLNPAETGVVSRKSELRELRHQATLLDQQLADSEAQLHNRCAQREAISEPIYFTQQRIADLVDEAHDVRVRLTQHRERRSGLHDEITLKQSELEGLEHEIAQIESQVIEAQRRAMEGEELARQVQEHATTLERDLAQKEQQRSDWERTFASARVELAQFEERLARHQQRCADLVAELRRCQVELQQLEQGLDVLMTRQKDGELARLRVGQALADSCALLEQAERRGASLLLRRDQLRVTRKQAEAAWQDVGGRKQQYVQQAHAHEMKAHEWRLRLDALCQRLREDYGVELAELYRQGQLASSVLNSSEAGDSETQQDAGGTGFPPPLEVEPTQREIDELRKKLARLGAVNLDALEELAQIERRLQEQRTQHDDLTKSKNDLLQIIERINTDSRKLFLETFEAVRGHFQELFRKLFGGGMADILLEDESDVLESGIEINARPPGKELRSISLLSGGERTLTAVALLLAIFRSKPSPFCLLDEVDAALDEANNERLANLLREFLDMSQFIVITHKKRTMAVADVLYGITMQEAGVSRQISVRFEDWPDDESQTPLAA
jgi:chromosome segregation protein